MHEIMAYHGRMARNRLMPASAPDEKERERARIAVHQRLAANRAHRRLSADCGDPTLRALLQRIERAQVRQESRLLDWLLRRDADLALDLKTRPMEPRESEQAVQAEDIAEREAAEAEAESTEGWRQVQVIERRDVTGDLVALKLARPRDFAFVPGQYAKLRLGGVSRSYSIVSAPHEPLLEFFIELMPGGRMSDHLRHLAPGQDIGLGARPKGRFRLDERFPNQLMVATVTGVNPFIGMLRRYLHEGRRGQRFYLLHGASYQDEFGYRDELETIAGAHPDLLAYVPTVSRPDEPRNAGWRGERGRVDALVDKYIDQFGLSPDSTVLYACGHPSMVDIVEARFEPRGFAIKVEPY